MTNMAPGGGQELGSLLEGKLFQSNLRSQSALSTSRALGKHCVHGKLGGRSDQRSWTCWLVATSRNLTNGLQVLLSFGKQQDDLGALLGAASMQGQWKLGREW